ncbi:hypothetical protein NKH18_41195 [Streptomyces sp. M10(2022)]
MAKNRLNTFVYPTDYLGLGVTTYDGVRTVLVREAAKRSLRIETGGHGYDSFLPKADYPQFYESGGPLFDIYNPEALDAYVAKVLAFLRERPEITVFDCWPPDVGAFQKPILDRYGTPANAESVVVNELARVLREELPGVRVERIAYASTVLPPDPQYASDPEVIVDFAPYSRNYDGHLGDPAVGANTALASAARLADHAPGLTGDVRVLPAIPLAQHAGAPAQHHRRRCRFRVAARSQRHRHVQRTRRLDSLRVRPELRRRAGLGQHPGRRRLPRRIPPGSLRCSGSRRDAAVLRPHRHRPRHPPGRRTQEELRAGPHRSPGSRRAGWRVAPRTLVERLTRNLDIALADAEIGLAAEGSAELDAARRKYRALVHRNRFTGVCVPNMQAWWRWNGPDAQAPYADARIRRDVVDTYASPAAGFGDPDSSSSNGTASRWRSTSRRRTSISRGTRSTGRPPHPPASTWSRRAAR